MGAKNIVIAGIGALSIPWPFLFQKGGEDETTSTIGYNINCLPIVCRML
jgi:hypothetical protein